MSKILVAHDRESDTSEVYNEVVKDTITDFGFNSKGNEFLFDKNGSSKDIICTKLAIDTCLPTSYVDVDKELSNINRLLIFAKCTDYNRIKDSYLNLLKSKFKKVSNPSNIIVVSTNKVKLNGK
jgi:hypothetical protein